MPEPVYVIGIHDGHNSSACLLADGRVVFAIQEERLTGEKNALGFPARSIQACLDFGNLQPRDVTKLAFATHRSTPSRLRATEQSRASRREVTTAGTLRRMLWYPYYQTQKHMGLAERMKNVEASGFDRGQYADYEHHLCHAACAYYGLREDSQTSYVVVTVDGFGDLDCATVWVNRNGMLERIARTPFTDSLGTIYGITTGMMGFRPLEHEYKLMGMAPYASRAHSERMAQSFHNLLTVDEERMRFKRRTVAPSFLYARRIKNMISGERFDQVCAGLQLFTEELLVKLARSAVRATGVGRVLCAGGVFMNVKANKRLMEQPEIESLKIFPSCGDETLPMGAAYLAYIAEGGSKAAERIEPITDFYLGGDVSEESCRQAVESSGHEVHRYDDVEAELARILVAGKPVARCKGRMEFGARALGNRSILADPSNQDVVRVINRMVKNRDFWMPFAPVVRRERMEEYFVNPKDLVSPYMMLTFDTRDNFRDLIAAVHNADLTARPQVIEAQQNPDYYRLLQNFEAQTGRGVLLNTSFNLHGFPIVTTAKDAMNVFENSGLEYLNLGQLIVHKRHS
jgi:carbamoyltransferase